MSASLVGSEMCIRDSHLRRQGSPRPPLRLLSRLRRLRGPSKRRSSSSRSVSYTHLTLPTICSV
eukprot:13757529-Alexandrium_andersonii.AAC.1